MKTTKKTKLDYKLLTNIHDDLSKLASRIAWRQENLEDRKSHLERVSDEAERTKLKEGIKRSESVLNNLVREYNMVSSKLVVGRSKRYIAKKDTWFKGGTECKLLEDYQEAGGLYRGIYIVGENKGYDTFWHNKGYKEGDEVEMNEVCSHDEFNVC